MDLLRLTSLLIYLLGLYAFVSLAWIQFRPRRSRRWGGQRTARHAAPSSPAAEWAGATIMVACVLWFAIALVMTVQSLSPDLQWGDRYLRTAQFILTFAFPPLIMHVVYAGCLLATDRLNHPRWRLPILVTYVAGASICTFSLLAFYGVIATPGIRVGAMAGFSIGILFATSAIYSALAISRSRPASESPRQRSSRRAHLGLFAFMLVLVVLITAAQIGGAGLGDFLNLVGTSMPLIFIFLDLYNEDRFEFFDIFVKRGLRLLLTVLALAAYTAALLSVLDGLRLGASRPWIAALGLLPPALLIPWGYAKLDHWLDRLWLGRRYTTVEAIERFLSDVQDATDEQELIARAETGLATVFGAPARIELGIREAGGDFEAAVERPIRSGGRASGLVLIGPRNNQAPFFASDVALLDSLADLFCHMLENVRLQKRKQEDERRARELTLHASRSELKALRAQINPHFLFNALNAIAGLIHKDPLRADRTVEQLAEVFRYTLRRSEAEWAELAEELEFVRSYLDVERSRFGKRLEFDVAAEEGLESLRIPTMILQTLVENAVKHGAARVRGTARIDVGAGRDGERLVLRVANTGPRFDNDIDEGDSARAGFGLSNVRRRLRGYFGEDARLLVERDEGSDSTVVSIAIPLADERVAGGNRERRDSTGAAG